MLVRLYVPMRVFVPVTIYLCLPQVLTKVRWKQRKDPFYQCTSPSALNLLSSHALQWNPAHSWLRRMEALQKTRTASGGTFISWHNFGGGYGNAVIFGGKLKVVIGTCVFLHSYDCRPVQCRWLEPLPLDMVTGKSNACVVRCIALCTDLFLQRRRGANGMAPCGQHGERVTVKCSFQIDVVIIIIIILWWCDEDNKI